MKENTSFECLCQKYIHIWESVTNYKIVSEFEFCYPAMACFCLLHSGYDMEVMILIRIRYRYDTTLFLLLLVDIVVCDLYFVSHILLYLIITLILIIHINCINCISVGEYHGYSLTVCKSLL